MSQVGPTKGPWEYIASTEHHGPYVAGPYGDICDCYTMSNLSSLSVRNGGDSKPIHFQGEQADANAALIAEAGTVYSESGLSPRALLEQRDRLLEAIKLVRGLIVEAAETGFNCHDGDWAERLFASQAITLAALQPPQDLHKVEREDDWRAPIESAPLVERLRGYEHPNASGAPAHLVCEARTQIECDRRTIEAQAAEIERLRAQITSYERSEEGFCEVEAQFKAELAAKDAAVREECARIVEGNIYKDIYRQWPQWGSGTGCRSLDDETVKLTSALAAAIRANGKEG